MHLASANFTAKSGCGAACDCCPSWAAADAGRLALRMGFAEVAGLLPSCTADQDVGGHHYLRSAAR